MEPIGTSELNKKTVPHPVDVIMPSSLRANQPLAGPVECIHLRLQNVTDCRFRAHEKPMLFACGIMHFFNNH